MAVAPVSKIKLVVVSADGAKLVLTPAEFARMRLQPGMKVAVLDETTGHTPKGLTAKTQGQDLLLELPEHGLLAKVEGFEQIADFSFAEDINAITTAQHTGVAYAQATAPTPVATDAGGAAADTASAPTPAAAPAPASGTVGGFSLSTLGAILGGLALAGGGGGGGGAVVSAIVASVTGVAIDGYLSGSTVTRVNGSGNSVTTDANGYFSGLTGTGPIKVTGGVDQSTGQRFEGTMTAPEGSKVITPVTTLINTLAGNGANASQIQAATTEVLAKLGLPADFKVLTVDPVAQARTGTAEEKAAALEVFKAGVMVATALQVLSGGETANFADAATALTAALDANNTQTGVDLIVSSLGTVAEALNVATDLTSLTAALSTINDIGTVAEVAGAQASVLNQELGYTSTTPAITFTATVNTATKTVSFGASDTATGPITVNIDASGTATFVRAGVNAKTGATTVSVPNFADEAAYYKLDVPAASRVIVNVTGGDTADDVFSIDAANALQITLAGNLGTGQDAVYLKIQDANNAVANSRVLIVNTRGLTGAESVIFDFADVKDKVLLSADSYLANIGTIEVKKGEADLHDVAIPEGTVFIVNSGLTLTLDQLLASESISSVTGLARLTVVLNNASEITSGVLTSLAALNLIGLGAGEEGYIEIKVGDTVVASTQTGTLVSSNAAASNAILAIQGASLPSIPALTVLVDELQTQISLNAGDIATLSSSVATLNTAVNALKGSGAGSVTKSIADAIGVPSDDTATPAVTATGLWARIESLVGVELDALQAQITANDGDISGLVTRADALEAAVNTLKGSGAGSVASSISTALGAWPTYNSLTNTFGADGSGVYQAVADKLDQNVAALKLAIEGAGFTAGSYATLKDVQAALVLLEGADTVTGSVLADIKAAIGTWPTYNAGTNTFGTDGTGIYQAVADKLDQNVAALKLAIEGAGFTAGSYATLKDVQAALVLLEGDDTITGSVLADIKAAIGTWPTYDAGTNTFGTNGTGIYQAVADKLDQNVAALKLAIEGAGFTAGSYATLKDVQAALVLLEGADTVTGSVLADIKAAIGTWPTYDAGTNTFGTNGTGIYQAVADKLDQNVAALKLAIEGAGFTAGSYATLKDVQAALVLLEGDDTITGSVLADIKAAIGTWPTYDAGTNTFGTNGTGIYQAVADKLDQNVAALKLAIEGAGFTAGSYATLKDVQAALVLLEGADTVTGSVLADIKAAIGTWPTYDAGTNTFGTNGTGIYQAVADKLDQNVAALKLAIEGAGFTAGSYATLKDVQAALVLLEGDDTITGSVLADIKAAIGTWPTYDAGTNTFGTNGTGIYQAVADKLDQNVTALKLAIEGAGFTAGSYATLKDVQAALVLLEGADTVTGSVLADIKAAIGTWPTYNAGTNTFGTDGTGIYQAVADKLDQNVAALKLAIEGNNLTAGNYDTLVEIQAALVLLEGADTVEGSIAYDLLQQFNTLTTNYQAAIKAVALVPTVSVFGGDLADSVLETQEGSVTVRVNLSQVTAANDTVQLYLGSTALDLNGGTAGTAYTVQAADITAGYKDFVIAQADLGAAGDKAITAKVTSGTVTSNSSAGLYFTYSPDAAGPTAVATITDISADTGTSDSDFITNQSIQTVTGTLNAALAAGEKVQITVDGTNWVDATVSGTTWSAPALLSSANAGAGTLTVRTIDAAGNVTSGSATQGYTLDASAPTTPVITGGAAVLTNDNTPTLEFTTSPGAIVSVIISGSVVNQGVANGSGVYTFTPSAAMTDGNYSVTARASDAAGNLSALATGQLLTIDATATAAPTITSAALTNDATPVITGTAQAGSSVTVAVAGATYTVTATGGTWSVDTGSATPASGTLAINANGNNSVSVTATDAANNTSAAATQTLAVDSTAATVTITDNKTAVTNGDITYTITFSEAVSGFAASDVVVTNGTIQQFIKSSDSVYQMVVTPSANVTGNVTVDIAANAAYDAAGNGSAVATQSVQSIDTQAPAAPVVTVLADAQNANYASGFSVTEGADVSLAGASLDDDFDKTTAAGVDTYTAKSGAFKGTENLLVIATLEDAAGNVSETIQTLPMLDTTAPSSLGFALVSDTGSSDSDQTTRVGTVNVTGLDADATWQYTVNGTAGTPTWTTGVGSSFTLADGTYAIGDVKTRQTDAAGNVTTSSGNVAAITVDSLAPTNAVVSLSLSADTGSSVSDFTTQTASQTVSGSLAAVLATGETVKVSADNGVTWVNATATVGQTSWSAAVTLSGASALKAKVVDAAGNEGVTYSQGFVLDGTGPTAVATITDISADTGTSDSDYTTNASIQTVTGTLSAALAAGEKVQVSANGTNWFDATVGGTEWLAQVILTSGTHYLQVRTVDAAGNITDGAADVEYTLDRTAPSVPVITDSQGADDSAVLTNDSAPALVITAATGSTVSVYMNGAFVGNATESGTPGTFNFTSLALNDGVHHFTAKATDTAGNVSAASVSQALTVDATAPQYQSLTVTASRSGAALNAGASLKNGDVITITATYDGTVTGTPTAPTLTIGSESGQVLTAGVTSGNARTWTYTVSNAGTTDTGAISVVGGNFTTGVTDAAGNVATGSVTATQNSFVADTTLPTVTITDNKTSSTNGEITYTITFSEAVSGFTQSDVTVTNGTIRLFNKSSDSVYQMVVTPDVNEAGNITVDVSADVAVDAAGNGNSVATQNTQAFDTAAPSAPVINTVATDDVVDALENGDGFDITGTGEVGATITLVLSSGRTLTGGNTITVDGDGNWSLAVDELEAGRYFKYGDELLTVYQTDSVGNVSAETKKLIDVVTTLVTGGDLSEQDLSGISKLELNADATLPSDTAKLPLAIDAKGYAINAALPDGLAIETQSPDLNRDDGVNSEFYYLVTGSTNGGVWGSDIYTDDSSIGAAAVHAGILAVGQTGIVKVTILGPQTTFASASRNGVSTYSFGPYDGSFSVAAGPTLDLTDVTLSNLGDLTLSDNVILTVTASQASAFNSAGTVSLTGSGELAVATSGNLSGFDLANVSLRLTGNATLPDSTAELPDSIYAGGHAITLSGSVNLSSVTLTAPGDFIVSSNTLTVSAAQANVIAAAMSTPLTATVVADAASDLIADLVGADDNEALTLTVNAEGVGATDAADLVALNGKTSLAINLAVGVTSVSGSFVNLNAVYVTNAAQYVGEGDEDITLTDSSATAENIILIKSKTTGSVDASLVTDIDGTAEDVAQVANDGDITTADFDTALAAGTAAAADLLDISAGNGTGTLDASLITDIDGTVSDVLDVVNDGDITTADFDTALAAGTAAAADLLDISAGNGMGTLDASLITDIDGTVSDVLDVVNDGDITTANFDTALAAGTAAAADLLDISAGNGTGTLDASLITDIDGTVSDVLDVVNDGDITTANFDTALAAGTAAAADLLDISAGNGTGTLDASLITDIDGTVSDVLDVVNDGDITTADFDTALAAGTAAAADLLDISAGNGMGTLDASLITDIDGTVSDVLDVVNDGDITTANFDTALAAGTAAAADLLDISAGNGTGTLDASLITDIDGTAEAVAQVANDGDITTADFDTALAAGTAAAADLLDISAGNGTGTLDASLITTITGTVADVKTIVADSTITTASNYAAVITDATVSVADVNTVAGDTLGVVTATLTTGNLASFSSLNTLSTDVITVNVSDMGGAILAATDFSTLGGKTAGVVTVQYAVTISGTSAELMAALVTAETKVVAASANITFTDAPSLAQFAAIDGVTSGTLSYTSIADTAANLVTDAAATTAAVAYNKPVTVTNSGTVQAADLVTISSNTTEPVTATAATTISGSAVNLVSVVNDTGIATATNYNAVVTGSIGVSDISTIDNDTTGTVTVANVTDTLTAIQTYNGASAANAAILQNATGTITANGDANPDTIDLSAVLKGITINGLAGSDALTATNFADVIAGGRDADSLLGKGGADTFYFATGDAPTSGVGAATYDRINDFAIAQDKIDLQVAPVLGSAETNNAANIGGVTGSAAIDAAGKVTFSGAGVDDLTLAEALVAVRSLVTGAGEIAFFEINDGSGGSYLYQENGSAANDTFIFLAGTTGIVDTSGIAGDSNTLFIV